MFRLWKRFEGEPRSVTWHLIVFAMALYFPVVGLSAVLAYRYVENEQADVKYGALSAARSFEGTVTTQVQGLRAAALALASARELKVGELDEFYTRAKEAVDNGSWVVLRDRTGKQVLNTRLSRDTPLPQRHTDEKGLAQVLAGREYLSDVFKGPHAGQDVVYYSVPVWANGQVLYELSVAITASTFNDLASKEAPRWQIALVGRDLNIIMRNPRLDVVGKPISDSSKRELEINPKPGVDYLYANKVISVSGQTLIGGFRRMPNGWTIFVAVGEDVYLQPVWRAIWAGALLTLIFIVVPPLLAGLIGLRITSAIDRLVWKAEHLARGEVVEPPVTKVKEVNMAAIAMHLAAKQIKAENAHQRLLVQELNHRVKNTLASIQAIARRTFNGVDRENYGRFEGRILALSATHNLLTDQQWTGADIRDIVKSELSPYKNVYTDGDKVILHARAAVSLATVFHELVTNASKFGALSVPDGKVELTWRAFKGNSGSTSIELDWVETNGPRVNGTRKKGFGTTLIQTSIQHELQGTVEIYYEPHGLRCHISILMFEEKPMMNPTVEEVAA
jgi:two-component sensor histidine kinase